MKTWYVIPARKDSKGVPFKNRKLFAYTAETIPQELSGQVIVTTDDEELLSQADAYGFGTRRRDAMLADDSASMKNVLLDLLESGYVEEEDTVILLYLTYPQRTWNDISQIHAFFIKHKANALSCCLDVADHPYLCFSSGPGYTGVPIVEHSHYRRQDYPECFRLSLFVGIFTAFKIRELNDLLVCPETLFYRLSKKVIDIDNEIDMIHFKNGNEC